MQNYPNESLELPARGQDTRRTPHAMADTSPAPAETGWCPFADKRVSPNFFPGRDGQRVKAVVLHIAQGTYEGAISWLTNPTSQASAHFIVAKDGRIAQMVSLDDSAWGNGLRYENGVWLTPSDPAAPANPTWSGLVPGINPNLYTISIEHEGLFTEPWTPAMYAASVRVLHWIRDQIGIAYVWHQTLIGHYEIDSVRRPNDPGPHVEWQRMINDLSALPTQARTALLAGANRFGIPLNDQAALAKFAIANKLGIPLTDEFRFTYQDTVYVGQVWSLGVVYAKDGEFDRIFVSTG
ncbi:MAG: N-acetylmuramoyl-L-alanine amidase [Chloroflexi bacterium]|nr:N-acetylmuramoyl-L-alanine amidase [Chloroflexota bacterium]